MAFKKITSSYRYPKLPDPRGVREATGEEAKPGDVLAEGRFRGRNKTPSKFGKHSLLVEENNGQVVSLNPSGQLERLLEMGNVRVGDMVRITYLGLERIQKGDFKGQKAHQFGLEVDEEARVSADSLTELPEEAATEEVDELPEVLLAMETATTAPKIVNAPVTTATLTSEVETTKKSYSNQELVDRYRSKIRQ